MSNASPHQTLIVTEQYSPLHNIDSSCPGHGQTFPSIVLRIDLKDFNSAVTPRAIDIPIPSHRGGLSRFQKEVTERCVWIVQVAKDAHFEQGLVAEWCPLHAGKSFVGGIDGNLSATGAEGVTAQDLGFETSGLAIQGELIFTKEIVRF